MPGNLLKQGFTKRHLQVNMLIYSWNSLQCQVVDFFCGLCWKKYFLRVIPTLAYSHNIVSDRPSGIYIYILTLYLTFFLAYTLTFYLTFWHSFWHSLWHVFGSTHGPPDELAEVRTSSRMRGWRKEGRKEERSCTWQVGKKINIKYYHYIRTY